MCGIAAIFAHAAAAPPVSRPEILAIRDKMARRGPDGEGLWISKDGRIGLAHQRLAVIDLSPAGAQPMFLEAGDSQGRTDAESGYAITYNGEIYNYRELRKALEGKGHRFRSNSDTEVLLHLYRRYGAEMVHHLRGMYAFAIWDGTRRGVFLARDPFGIKPLYYSDGGGVLRVASQVKALLGGNGGGIDTAPDPAGHVGFFLWGYVPEPHTLYKGIRALPAGTTLWAGEDGPEPPRTFFDLTAALAEGAAKAEESSPQRLRALLTDSLRDSVRHHMVADVPVGVFLSSGLDSATLVAMASESGAGNLHTLTLGFEEFRGREEDETRLAETVAARYKTRHQTRFVKGTDFRADYEDLLGSMDQPSIDGVNTYFVSKAAAGAGMKVALSGLGGDELFAGYPSFRQIPRLVRALSFLRPFPALGRGFRLATAPLLKSLTSPKYASLLEFGTGFGDAYLLRRGLFLPWELPAILDPDMVREGWRALDPLARLEATAQSPASDRARVAALELTFYMRNQLLRDSDWAGMAHGLEIRVPLVDVALFRELAPMLNGPNPPGKRDMAGAPSTPLPPEVLKRPKTGFCVPVRDWLQGTPGGADSERGLRGWARRVYAAQPFTDDHPSVL